MVFQSCKDNESGCTDPKADNYSFNAVLDDGSCLYNGRTLEEVLNNGGFTQGGGDTIYVGCMDTSAFNYDPKANVSGPCYFIGCTDSSAVNFDPKATISNANDCIYAGCTDPNAENYDPRATIDDGSCIDIRQKFVGDWTVTTDCGFAFPTSGNQNISIVNGTQNEILFSPFILGGDATGSVSNRTQVSIGLTNQGPYAYSATGTINAAQDEIILNINYDNSIPFIGGSGSCIATYEKQ